MKRVAVQEHGKWQFEEEIRWVQGRLEGSLHLSNICHCRAMGAEDVEKEFSGYFKDTVRTKFWKTTQSDKGNF